MDPLHQLDTALAARDRADRKAEAARLRVREVIRTIAPDVTQADIVRRTGWSREYIRQIVRRSTKADIASAAAEARR